MNPAVESKKLFSIVESAEELVEENRLIEENRKLKALIMAIPLLPSKTIASILGRPPAAVESALRRLRGKLDDSYIDLNDTHPDNGRRRNETRYIYRVCEVLPMLKAHFKDKSD